VGLLTLLQRHSRSVTVLRRTSTEDFCACVSYPWRARDSACVCVCVCVCVRVRVVIWSQTKYITSRWPRLAAHWSAWM